MASIHNSSGDMQQVIGSVILYVWTMISERKAHGERQSCLVTMLDDGSKGLEQVVRQPLPQTPRPHLQRAPTTVQLGQNCIQRFWWRQLQSTALCCRSCCPPFRLQPSMRDQAYFSGHPKEVLHLDHALQGAGPCLFLGRQDWRAQPPGSARELSNAASHGCAGVP